MERLTRIDEDGDVYLPMENLGAGVDRLGAYEATGLMPEEVTALQRDWSDLCTIVGECGGLDRLRELAEANKDGRVVILPCKVGDTVFALVDTGDCRRMCVECNVEFVNIGGLGTTIITGDVNTHWQYGVAVQSFGKTVFFSRKEAEAALKEAADG